MTKNLMLSGVNFDPTIKTITVAAGTPLNIEVLADLVMDKFRTTPMLVYEVPLEVLEMQDSIYYVFSWRVVGPVNLGMLDGKRQHIVHT